MKKIIMLVLLFSSMNTFAQQKMEDLSALKDTDYVNFAYKHWGQRPEGWAATEGLRNLIDEVSRETIDCSKEIKYVPKPTLAPPGISYFVGYVISLRGKNKKISAYNGYEVCLKKILYDRQTAAYLTQNY